MSSSSSLNPKLAGLLESLRIRIRRYVVLDSVLAIAAVALLAFWIGLALDYLPVRLGGTEMPSAARAIYLLAALAIIVYLVFKFLLGRLARPLPDDSLALLVERHYPSLGGRLVTAVQLMRSGRQGDAHDIGMLDQVHQQAIDQIDQVDPAKVFRQEPLIHKASVVIPLALMALVFIATSPSGFARAASRLTLLSDEPWPRKADLKMIGIELPSLAIGDEQEPTIELIEFDQSGVVRLPRGSSSTLRIAARADDVAEVPNTCTVYFSTDSGLRGQANMRRIGRVRDDYQSFVLDGPPLTSLDESMGFSVHGLDDRLSDFRIEAVEPPAIVQSDIEVRYPDYLRVEAGLTETSIDAAETPIDADQIDRKDEYQSGLRVREGSRVTMVARSGSPLGGIDVYISQGGGPMSKQSAIVEPNLLTARIRIDNFLEATSIQLVPRDPDGISAQAPYRYFLGIVRDEPPALKVRLQGIGSAVTARARIPLVIEAQDDYGLADMTVTTSIESGDELKPQADQAAKTTAELSIVDRPNLDREGDGQWVVDLRDLSQSNRLPMAASGSTLMLVTEAKDRYDLDGGHVTRGELFRLNVVSDDQLLALLERQELGLRSRLEQTITETVTLRDTLDSLRREIESTKESSSAKTSPPEDATDVDETLTSDATEMDRKLQVLRLRTQQSNLQATKTNDELSGIVASLGDLFDEMVNNRVDTVDRQTRLRDQVRKPLADVIAGSLAKLRAEVSQIETELANPEAATQTAAMAVQSAEKTLIELNAVLEKMLDLETYNEVLDLFRGLIEDQDSLLEDTKSEQKKKVLDLFQ
jgi:hypothetical protein